MKILFDARCLQTSPGGVATFTRNLLYALALHQPSWRFLAVIPKSSSPLPHPWPENIDWLPIAPDTRSHPAADFWEHITLPRWLKAHQVDLVHGPAYLIPWRRLRVPKVVSIYDLTPFLRPDDYPPRFGFYIRMLIKRSSRAADLILVPSQATRTDLIRILEIPESKIQVIPGAPGPEFATADADERERLRRLLSLPEHFILSVGAIEPRKNLPALISAFERFRRRTGLPHELLWVGGRGYQSEQLMRRVDASPSRVVFRHFTHVPEGDLPTFYRCADLFVFPSFYEGFGLPPLEAMACGVPVICSDGGSLKEIVGEGARLFAPDDSMKLSQIMEQILMNPETHQEWSGRSQRWVSRFRWGKSAETTAKAYASLVEKK